jgi:hypothetical protein
MKNNQSQARERINMKVALFFDGWIWNRSMHCRTYSSTLEGFVSNLLAREYYRLSVQCYPTL